MKRLLIDIGNTRLKWALAVDDQLPPSTAVAHDGNPAAVLAQLPADTVDAVWVAHVAGEATETALDQAVRQRYGHRPQYARSTAQWHGLRSAYAEPSRLGIDRWLGMIAAWSQHGAAFCVIDAGTALTADNVDDHGQHQGGFIAAGLYAQQRAVLGTTRFATRDSAALYDDGLGRDTEACVRQGAMLACLGAIDRASHLVSPTAARLMTGGDAALLLPHLATGWRHHPDLVLEGLLSVALDRSSAIDNH